MQHHVMSFPFLLICVAFRSKQSPTLLIAGLEEDNVCHCIKNCERYWVYKSLAPVTGILANDYVSPAVAGISFKITSYSSPLLIHAKVVIRCRCSVLCM